MATRMFIPLKKGGAGFWMALDMVNVETGIFLVG